MMMIGAGLAAITLISILIIFVGGTSEDATLVFNVVVPVIASWIGTVLAFYFGAENYERATAQALWFIGQPEEDQQPVTAVMKHKDLLTYYSINGDSLAADDVTLATIQGKFLPTVTSLPILQGNTVTHMVPKRKIDEIVCRKLPKCFTSN